MQSCFAFLSFPVYLVKRSMQYLFLRSFNEIFYSEQLLDFLELPKMSVLQICFETSLSDKTSVFFILCKILYQKYC